MFQHIRLNIGPAAAVRYDSPSVLQSVSPSFRQSVSPSVRQSLSHWNLQSLPQILGLFFNSQTNRLWSVWPEDFSIVIHAVQIGGVLFLGNFFFKKMEVVRLSHPPIELQTVTLLSDIYSFDPSFLHYT